jgi:hypothetical protein
LDRVLEAWSQGKAFGKNPDMNTRGRNSSWGHWGIKNPCWTDGETVYSYAMPIAWHNDGSVVVADRETAMRPDGGGRAGISMTTRRHIDAVNAYLRINPPDTLMLAARGRLALAARSQHA